MPWIPIEELLSSWEAGVALLREDVEAGRATFDWTVDDYAGLLYLRQAIDVAVPDLDLRLDRADEQFRDLTEIDTRGKGVSIIDDSLPRSPWVWTRLPRRGSLRTEFEAIWEARTECK